jgi:antibiotic biosynthesis monooxygenase (ABM) superfamily enzyme
MPRRGRTREFALVGAGTAAAVLGTHGKQTEGNTMATVLFVVRANVAKDKEAAFNKWYNEEHVPMLLRYNGAVSARRYKKILGEDKYEYMAVYEFANEAVFERFQTSDYLKELIAEYNANFGEVSQRERSAYVQLWPA